jgi:hypothetical protein
MAKKKVSAKKAAPRVTITVAHARKAFKWATDDYKDDYCPDKRCGAGIYEELSEVIDNNLTYPAKYTVAQELSVAALGVNRVRFEQALLKAFMKEQPLSNFKLPVLDWSPKGFQKSVNTLRTFAEGDNESLVDELDNYAEVMKHCTLSRVQSYAEDNWNSDVLPKIIMTALKAVRSPGLKFLWITKDNAKARKALEPTQVKLAKGFVLVTEDNLDEIETMHSNTKLVAFKFTNAQGKSPMHSHPSLTYKTGHVVEVKNADTDKNDTCSHGVNVATRAWCENEHRGDSRLFLVHFTPKDIACVPHGTDGKFRLFRCTVGKEIQNPWES